MDGERAYWRWNGVLRVYTMKMPLFGNSIAIKLSTICRRASLQPVRVLLLGIISVFILPTRARHLPLGQTDWNPHGQLRAMRAHSVQPETIAIPFIFETISCVLCSICMLLLPCYFWTQFFPFSVPLPLAQVRRKVHTQQQLNLHESRSHCASEPRLNETETPPQRRRASQKRPTHSQSK